MSTYEKTAAAPAILVNQHGAHFVLLRWTVEDSGEGPIECGEVVGDDGHRAWLPADQIRRWFRVAVSSDSDAWRRGFLTAARVAADLDEVTA